MKNYFLTLALPFVFLASACSTPPSNFVGDPIEHSIWDGLLKKHVSETGKVDYQGFIQDSLIFNQYIELLSSNHPNDSWSKNERLAYWVNAYNAFTVQLIIRNYPTESIKDLGGSLYKINTPWDIRFILIEGADYDLNNIEHDILREEFDEPRVHFAVNCASVSCPKLRNEAFTADKIDQQLDQAAYDFINNPEKNQITEEVAHLSRIFKWFSGDFEKGQTREEFINKYSEVKITDDTKIKYLEYFWELNE